MLPWQSCAVGDAVDSIDTPALVLDLDAFERNLDQIMAAAGSMRVRPHAKSHKCPEVARQQIKRGAVGICCQKLSEAAVFAQAGIQDILLTNQVVGPRKLERLRDLSQQVKLGVLVDDAQQIQALAQVMATQPRSLDIYVEVEVGAGRCGASPEAVLPLVQQILVCPGLKFAGLHCYHGPAQHLRSTEQRSQTIAGVAQIIAQTRSTLEAAGIAVPCVTGAGTGTFWHERDSGVYHEIQAGSFAFMDRDYASNVAGPGDVRFEHALFIKTTVLSATKPNIAIVDAGLKASSVDSGMPAVHSPKGLKYLKASDEHGVIELESGQRLELGDTLWLIPGHCDPTMNLYDDLVCIRNGKVEAIWPIAARGASL